MEPKVRSASRIAGRQHGAITVAQLLGLGLTRETIKSWVRRGLLHREFRGVYRLGHRAPSVAARYMAAVLACGEGAVLSGLAAAHLYDLVKGQPPLPDVSAPAHRRIPGIHTRRRTVPGRIWNAIPTATVAQTLIDLAAVLSLDALAEACHHAGIRYGVSAVDAHGATSAAHLRAIFHGDAAVLLSRMEREFRRLLEQHGLPRPITNRKAGAHYVDCRWPAHHLTVELDGYRFHRSRHAWQQDRDRERHAYARGDQHRRYTYADVCENPAAMLAELHALLPGFPANLQ
jgi:very-short-patch-repair endonuclease